jgi:hypothetical protein
VTCGKTDLENVWMCSLTAPLPPPPNTYSETRVKVRKYWWSPLNPERDTGNYLQSCCNCQYSCHEASALGPTGLLPVRGHEQCHLTSSCHFGVFFHHITSPGLSIQNIATCFQADFLLGLFFDHDDGGDMFFWNVGWLPTEYTAVYSRR